MVKVLFYIYNGWCNAHVDKFYKVMEGDLKKHGQEPILMDDLRCTTYVTTHVKCLMHKLFILTMLEKIRCRIIRIISESRLKLVGRSRPL
ncbi:hypothetical protein CR513_26765, partial [Mucuna pruriens]